MHIVRSEIVTELLVTCAADDRIDTGTVIMSIAPTAQSSEPALPSQLREDADGDLDIPRKKRPRTRRDDSQSPQARLVHNGDRVIELETMAIGSADVTGTQLWRASFLLAEYLLLRSAEVDGTTLLELGAGVGFVSLVAARMATTVFATDGDVEALRVCERNTHRNPWSRDRVNVRHLEWVSNHEDERDSATQPRVPARFVLSPFDHDKMASRVDWIIASDVLYDDDVADCFLDTLHRLMLQHPNATVLVAAERRIVFSALTLSEISLGYDALQRRQCCHHVHCSRTTCVISCPACNSTSTPHFVMTPITIDSIPRVYDYDRVSTLLLWQLHTVISEDLQV